MGVTLGVIDSTIVAKKQKNLLNWLPEVLSGLVCMTSSIRVPCQAWETEYNHYIVKPKHWQGLRRFQMLPVKNNVFRETWCTRFPVKRNSLVNRNTVVSPLGHGVSLPLWVTLNCQNSKVDMCLFPSCLTVIVHLEVLKSWEILRKHTVTIVMKLTCHDCLHTTMVPLLSYIYGCISVYITLMRHYLTSPQVM